LSGPGAEELLHLMRACWNSSFEKGTQIEVGLDPISLRTSSSIWQWRAKLNVAESQIECSMESFPETFGSDTQITFIFYGFSCRKFALVNPIHQFPWAMTLVRNFLDLRIEK